VKARPARLDDGTGRFLELEVIGYEYALKGGQILTFETASGEEDVNWLVVRMMVSDGATRWSSTDPVLETPDLEHLPTWLRSLRAVEEGTAVRWETTEPNLALDGEREGETFKITAWLWQEWRKPGTDLEEGPTRVEMTVDDDDVNSFAEALDLYAKEFPWRKGR
jgi:hypothetical protein